MAELSPLEHAGHYALGFAGDTFNTAWYLAKAGSDIHVSYFTCVGTDQMSQDMLSFMSASDVDTSHIRELEGQTVGLYLIQLSNGERSFAYWRGQSAARCLAQDAAALDAAISQADIIYFSGITLAILTPKDRERLFAALRQARTLGKTIAFDTNLRRRLWSSTQDMLETTSRAAGLADLILPSYEDEAAWFGDSTAQATLDRYLQLGAEKVIVKDSANSVLYHIAGQSGVVPVAPHVDVVDTTAAGDSFNACVLACLARSGNLVDGIKQGCQLAREVIGQKGALVPVDMNSMGTGDGAVASPAT